VRFSDLDIVGHVNNVKYMEWCVDAALPDGIKTRAIEEFEINFLHEALLGDHVVLKGVADVVSLGNALRISAIREEDGQEVIRARIVWAEKPGD